MSFGRNVSNVSEEPAISFFKEGFHVIAMKMLGSSES